MEGGGGGFVTLVTAPEKPGRLPNTFEEKEDTLFTTEAANADPGILGREMVLGILGFAVGVAVLTG